MTRDEIAAAVQRAETRWLPDDPADRQKMVDGDMRLLAAILGPHHRPQRLTRLSSRQMLVARLVAQGFTDEQIAAELCVGAETVKTHLVEARRRLHARNRAHLAALVTREAA